MTRPHDREAPVRRPLECPFCRSRDTDTLAKKITSETYWRCRSCGELWNAARLEREKSLRR